MNLLLPEYSPSNVNLISAVSVDVGGDHRRRVGDLPNGFRAEAEMASKSERRHGQDGADSKFPSPGRDQTPGEIKKKLWRKVNFLPVIDEMEEEEANTTTNSLGTPRGTSASASDASTIEPEVPYRQVSHDSTTLTPATSPALRGASARDFNATTIDPEMPEFVYSSVPFIDEVHIDDDRNRDDGFAHEQPFVQSLIFAAVSIPTSLLVSIPALNNTPFPASIPASNSASLPAPIAALLRLFSAGPDASRTASAFAAPPIPGRVSTSVSDLLSQCMRPIGANSGLRSPSIFSAFSSVNPADVLSRIPPEDKAPERQHPRFLHDRAFASGGRLIPWTSIFSQRRCDEAVIFFQKIRNQPLARAVASL